MMALNHENIDSVALSDAPSSAPPVVTPGNLDGIGEDLSSVDAPAIFIQKTQVFTLTKRLISTLTQTLLRTVTVTLDETTRSAVDATNSTAARA